jgi:hypothetical protein
MGVIGESDCSVGCLAVDPVVGERSEVACEDTEDILDKGVGGGHPLAEIFFLHRQAFGIAHSPSAGHPRVFLDQGDFPEKLADPEIAKDYILVVVMLLDRDEG